MAVQSNILIEIMNELNTPVKRHRHTKARICYSLAIKSTLNYKDMKILKVKGWKNTIYKW